MDINTMIMELLQWLENKIKEEEQEIKQYEEFEIEDRALHGARMDAFQDVIEWLNERKRVDEESREALLGLSVEQIQEIRSLALSGQMLRACRYVRNLTGLGLIESKRFVLSLQLGMKE